MKTKSGNYIMPMWYTAFQFGTQLCNHLDRTRCIFKHLRRTTKTGINKLISPKCGGSFVVHFANMLSVRSSLLLLLLLLLFPLDFVETKNQCTDGISWKFRQIYRNCFSSHFFCGDKIGLVVLFSSVGASVCVCASIKYLELISFQRRFA